MRAAYEGPVLLDSPHSGTHYPPSFGHACPRALLRQTEDAFVDEIFGFGPGLGATLVRATFPRSFIDANRGAGDTDPLLLAPEDAATLGTQASAKSQLGMGLVWRLVDGHAIYDGPLPLAEIRHRIDGYWRPYQQAVLQAWERVTARHGGGIHLNCHSMPSCSRLYPPEFGGVMPYDLVIGDRDGTTASAALTQRVVTFLRARGRSVGVNNPFKGVELVRLTGQPSRGRHSLQVEINKRTYMDEGTLEKHAGFAEIQADMKALVAFLA
ncbi:MAG: N-formylglutamate amidohydrolase [Burkholderiales bacterium]|nr:N-formylglutamate amidohydrolase [Burkholderiales bacterium]